MWRLQKPHQTEELIKELLRKAGKEMNSIDCPLSKGNQAAHTKFERPNGKNTKSNFFLIGQELVRTAHLKAK